MSDDEDLVECKQKQYGLLFLYKLTWVAVQTNCNWTQGTSPSDDLTKVYSLIWPGNKIRTNQTVILSKSQLYEVVINSASTK